MWECYNKNMTNRTTLTETEIVFTNAQRVARLATADADGHPHIVPVCYAYDGTHFYIPLDEKPKKVDESKLRRVRNIVARHEASLLIDQYDDDWSHLGYVLYMDMPDCFNQKIHCMRRRLFCCANVTFNTEPWNWKNMQ